MTYDDDIMLCHFTIKKVVEMNRHSHEASQIGYMLDGCMQFSDGNGVKSTLMIGDSYVFSSKEVHGCIALEDSVYIEVFTPSRVEYK